MTKKKLAYFIVTPVASLQDEEGNILGVEQMPGSLIYHPFTLSLSEAAAIINEQLAAEEKTNDQGD